MPSFENNDRNTLKKFSRGKTHLNFTPQKLEFWNFFLGFLEVFGILHPEFFSEGESIKTQIFWLL